MLKRAALLGFFRSVDDGEHLSSVPSRLGGVAVHPSSLLPAILPNARLLSEILFVEVAAGLIPWLRRVWRLGYVFRVLGGWLGSVGGYGCCGFALCPGWVGYGSWATAATDSCLTAMVGKNFGCLAIV